LGGDYIIHFVGFWLHQRILNTLTKENEMSDENEHYFEALDNDLDREEEEDIDPEEIIFFDED
jgi:hypothetical protein